MLHSDGISARLLNPLGHAGPSPEAAAVEAGDDGNVDRVFGTQNVVKITLRAHTKIDRRGEVRK